MKKVNFIEMMNSGKKFKVLVKNDASGDYDIGYQSIQHKDFEIVVIEGDGTEVKVTNISVLTALVNYIYVEIIEQLVEVNEADLNAAWDRFIKIHNIQLAYSSESLALKTFKKDLGFII